MLSNSALPIDKVPETQKQRLFSLINLDLFFNFIAKLFILVGQ